MGIFLRDKSEVHGIFKKFAKRAQNEFDVKIKRVRSDNGTEFKNTNIEEFLNEEGIKHEFSVPYTPQQNSVVERKNRTLIEIVRAMLNEYKTPTNYWAKAVSMACHAINRLYLYKIKEKTAYELLTGNKPKVHYFRVFGSKCFILNKKSKSSKFAPKVDEGFVLSYGTNEHGYHVFNKTTGNVEMAIDVTFDETDGSQKEQVNVEIVGKEEAPHQSIKKLAIGDVKPIESQDEDEDTIVPLHHDSTTHHVTSNAHGEASASRYNHDGKSNDAQGQSQVDEVINVDEQAQDQLNGQERSEDNSLQDHGFGSPINQGHDDEDDGPIQRRVQVTHPRVHHTIQWDHPIDNILGSI